MYHAPSKRRKRAQLTFIYTLMGLAVVGIVAVLILVVQGYRYNRFDGKLEQGGLVQFNSRPTGATVMVDGATLTNRTASKITLSPGKHEITMTRDGYFSWKKSVTVKPGGVLWLNYALLMPTNPKVTTTAALHGVVTPLFAPSRKTVALFQQASQPEITLMPVDVDKPEQKVIALPATLYTAPAAGESSEFALVSWDNTSRHLIVKHTFGGKSEYISVDTEDVARSRNLTTSLGVDITQVLYSVADSGTVYILTGARELRRADIIQTTLSGPLATNVESISMTDRAMVFYTTLPNSDGARTVGYVTSGLAVAKRLKSYNDSQDGTVHAAIATYYGQRYVVISHGEQIDIYRNDLPPSDSTRDIALSEPTTIPFKGGAQYLGFAPTENRFVYAARGASAMTYDLELLVRSDITLPAPLTRGVEWLDSYHIAVTAGGDGYFYDYDGTNAQKFAPGALAHPAVLVNGERYLCYFVQSGEAVELRRVQLVE